MLVPALAMVVATLTAPSHAAAQHANICGAGMSPVAGAVRTWDQLDSGGGQSQQQQPPRPLAAVQVTGADIVWSHLPTLPAAAKLTVCAETVCKQQISVSVDSAEDGGSRANDAVVAAVSVSGRSSPGTCPAVVHVQVAIDSLHKVYAASSSDGSSELAACSDGVDNDGDGLIDAIDPGCDTPAGSHEDSDNAASTSLSWDWGAAPDGDFMRSLRWTDPVTGIMVPVVDDEPSAGVVNGCRWWPHGGNCSHWTQSYSNNSAREVQDWAWQIQIPDGHGGGPQFFEQNGAITKRLVSSTPTTAVFESYSKRLQLRDVYTLRGSTMYISINATSLVPTDTIRATFLTQFGSLQLGPAAGHLSQTTTSSEERQRSTAMWHLGNKRLGSLDRNWSFVEACVYPYDGAAPMPSRACFSAASAMGDANHFSVGLQCLTPISPDGTDALMSYMDVPRNPRTPTSTTTLTLVLRPGETRTFVLALKVAPPAGAGLPRQAVLASMETAVEPYVQMFHSVWGQTPAYCPTPSTSYEDAINYGLNRHPICGKRYPLNNPISRMQNCNPWGNDTMCDCWWANGTRMYDVFNIDRLRRGSIMKEFGMPYHTTWRPGVQSSHLTTPSRYEQCEFNPNAEVMDPHQDVFWNQSVWQNISDAAAAAGFSLGWGLRGTEEILTPDNQSATIVVDHTRPGGFKINSGICVNFEGFYNDTIGNATSPDSNGRGVQWGNLIGAQTDRLLARVKTLVGRGVRSFYMDSFIAPGRFEAVRRMRRAFAEGGLGKQLFIFRESSNDVDILAMGQMPW